MPFKKKHLIECKPYNPAFCVCVCFFYVVVEVCPEQVPPQLVGALAQRDAVSFGQNFHVFGTRFLQVAVPAQRLVDHFHT
jgi:hypothetical protein